MKVLLNHSMAFELAQTYPQQIGLFVSPGKTWQPRGLPYGIDNGRFVVWSKGKEWDDAGFLDTAQKMLARQPAEWIVVPDVVASAFQTLEWWDEWAPRLRDFGIPLAMAVQDGMRPEDVRRKKPDVVFVGGSFRWKWRTVWEWCQNFPRVHVGRVNTERFLWNAHRCGAESVDGTGWFRGDQVQLAGLHRYLSLAKDGLGPAQLEFQFAEAWPK